MKLKNKELIWKAKNKTGFHTTVSGYIVGFVKDGELRDYFFTSRVEADLYYSWLIGALAADLLGLEPAPADRLGKTPLEWLLAAQAQNLRHVFAADEAAVEVSQA